MSAEFLMIRIHTLSGINLMCTVAVLQLVHVQQVQVG